MSDRQRIPAYEMIEVARVQGLVEAELVRGILESHGLVVQLRASASQQLWPMNVGELGEVAVQVPVGDAREASELLARHRRAGLVVLSGDRPPSEA